MSIAGLFGVIFLIFLALGIMAVCVVGSATDAPLRDQRQGRRRE